MPQMVELFNLGGRKVEQVGVQIQPDVPSLLHMDLSILPVGVYLLRVQTLGHTVFHKIVVQPSK